MVGVVDRTRAERSLTAEPRESSSIRNRVEQALHGPSPDNGLRLTARPMEPHAPRPQAFAKREGTTITREDLEQLISKTHQRIEKSTQIQVGDRSVTETELARMVQEARAQGKSITLDPVTQIKMLMTVGKDVPVEVLQKHGVQYGTGDPHPQLVAIRRCDEPRFENGAVVAKVCLTFAPDPRETAARPRLTYFSDYPFRLLK